MEIVSQLPNHSFSAAKLLYEECGPDIDWAIRVFEEQTPAEEFLEGQREAIKVCVSEAMKNPLTRGQLVTAIASVKAESPLGNTFVGTKLVVEMIEKKFMYEMPNGAAVFRNNFVLRNIIEAFNE